MTLRSTLFGFTLLIVISIGCSDHRSDRSGTPPAGPNVVATYAGGVITSDAIDQAILEIPERERPTGKDLSVERYVELIRYLVAERILLVQSESMGLASDPRVVWESQQLRRQILVQAYLQRHLPAVEEPSEKVLRDLYEANRWQYDREAKRLVTHLFKRYKPGDDPEMIREQVEALRQRVVGGENFALLAAEYSDSESRHRAGNIGWLKRGQLPAELEATIFSLEERTPSQPIVSKEGVHLFFVERIVESKQFSFAEVRATVAQRWLQDRSREAADGLAEGLPPVKDLWVVSPDQLWPLIERGDPQAPVLRTHDYEITVARFRQMMADDGARTDQDTNPKVRSTRLLENLEQNERIYAAAVISELDRDSFVAARLDRAENDVLIKYARREALMRMLSSRHDLVDRYYHDNELRFATPLRLRLRRIRVPFEEGRANEIMGRLEDAVATLGAASDPDAADPLQELADELGSEVEEIGWNTLQEVAQINSTAARLLASLETGALSPPYQSTEGLEVLQIVERREPEPRPLASVVDQVHAAYLAEHEHELFAIWMEGALSKAGLEIHDTRVKVLSGT